MNSSHFKIANFLFTKEQMSGGKVNEFMELWDEWNKAVLPDGEGDVPFANKDDLHATIDSITVGDILWQSFSVIYDGDRPDGEVPTWMHKKFDVWFRCPRSVLHHQLGNADFAKDMDYSPKRVFTKDRKREYCDLMSGNWAWRQADELTKVLKDAAQGTTFCPVILGSDKTTVSVATGSNEYYPVYISNGLVHNNARRAHRNAVSVLAFLAIPKSMYHFLDRLL